MVQKGHNGVSPASTGANSPRSSGVRFIAAPIAISSFRCAIMLLLPSNAVCSPATCIVVY